jgi:hypothetical protein
MGATWYVVTEAIQGGESVEVHRFRVAERADGSVGDDAARRTAEACARNYSAETGKPTLVEIVREHDGSVVDRQSGWFYYDPTHPQRDPHQDYYGY